MWGRKQKEGKKKGKAEQGKYEEVKEGKEVKVGIQLVFRRRG